MSTLHIPQIPRRSGSRARWPSFGIASALTVGLGTNAAAAPGDVTTDDDTDVATTADDDDDLAVEVRPDDDRDEHASGAESARIRLHIDSEALGGSFVHTEETRDQRGSNAVHFGTGLARPSLMDSGAALYSRPIIGFGLGAILRNDRTIIGAKMALTIDGLNIDSSNPTTAIGGRFVPYLHHMFLPDRWVRPYLEARFGVGGTAARTELEGSGNATGHAIYPIVGAGAGAHFFPRKWFSVDVGLNVDYAAPYIRTDYDNTPQEDTEFVKGADVLSYGLLLGVSVWFDGESRYRRNQRSRERNRNRY